MKNILLISASILMFSCNCNSKKTFSETTSGKTEIKKEFNIIVQDTVDDGMMLLGKINKEGFENDLFSEWYKENFNDHIIDTTTVEALKPKLNDVTIKVFMGTWCSDSQKEVPALYKILDAANFNYSNLEIVAVSHEKETPNHLEKDMNIQYVPTIIFYKNDNEIGRFVELAQETLEKDIFAILSDVGYKHSYEE